VSGSTNKKTVLEYVEAFNLGDMEALRRLFTPDALVYGVLGWGDLDKVIPIWREIHESFSVNLQVEALVEEGEAIAARYTERGRSVKPFRGQAATQQPYEIVAMEWFIIKDGLIHRRWGARDSASQFRQMGLSVL
jgi:steroid delta-isomerase-like uncharacterized protein